MFVVSSSRYSLAFRERIFCRHGGNNSTSDPQDFARQNLVAYIPPASNGGSQLDSSAGKGEPLNIIISGLSAPEVLSNSGLIQWANSIGFAKECLGFHIGNPQTANLGDGRGWVNETAVIRADYMNPLLGTCLESLTGGNHFRFWQQVTTNAFFLAASVEKNSSDHHDIVPNGYDLGRDQIVSAATSGPTTFGLLRYTTTVGWVNGLLQPGSQGINHDISIDGKVAVLTIVTQKIPHPIPLMAH
ncbi:uncharacterized protein EI90DRAFT_3145332 [Cantharellus anzutake]|uniref:uncharacterized protein n=1 Tax=Cantharellus anzutake TaxID=1750568 RepID=UPI001904E957|nr:uncharacterized protein EI90DRAFT_3145332 [Cantharellus anzutake]KAF8332615.1 hypothetical protein EI90DRAFT_3145332 [Cantharellus anzutake]